MKGGRGGWCKALLLLVSMMCSSCGQRHNERRDAMLEMKCLVASLHSNVQLRPGRPGFPKSTFLAESGAPTCSWRLTVLDTSLHGPFTDQLWKSPLNQPQDTTENRQLYTVKLRSIPSSYTHVFALVGTGTAFTDYTIGNGADTSDAEPDAILLLECKNNLIHWMEPGDIEVASLLQASDTTGIGTLEPNYSEGFLVAFVDGAVWCIRRDIPYKAISPFYTLDGARLHDRDVELAPYVIDKVPPLVKKRGQYFLDGS